MLKKTYIDFNPRSREGSDQAGPRQQIGTYDFNPRSREGSDGGPCQGFPRYHHISIHAPARGATAIQIVRIYILIFQSTLPRGERLQAAICVPHILRYFNPRSREGSDKMIYINLKVTCKFQSTLPRGERLGQFFRKHPVHMISIHAPARGATMDSSVSILIQIQFQSTLPRGERRFGWSLMPQPYNFNPRSREGSDED